MKLLNKITRPATATALALSVALSPMAATPAQAGNEEALIIGAIGTILLGAIAAESLNNGQGRITVHAGTTRHQQAHQQNQHQGRPNQHWQGQGRPNQQQTQQPNHPHKKVLPQRCAIDLGVHRHGGVVYGARCLNNRYPYAYKLPEQCKTHRLTNATGRHRPAYGARCLSRFGYETAQYGRRP